VEYGPEYFELTVLFKAIRRADIVLLVIDAVDGYRARPKISWIVEEGRACVIVVNKWDSIEKTLHDLRIRKHLKERLHFIDWAETISALTGQRVERFWN